MDRPKLTLGMATYEDFNGVYFTVQSLYLHHAEVMDQCEIICVDNNPESESGGMTKDVIGWLRTRERAKQIIEPFLRNDEHAIRDWMKQFGCDDRFRKIVRSWQKDDGDGFLAEAHADRIDAAYFTTRCGGDAAKWHSFAESLRWRVWGAKYIPAPEMTGTSQPRNRVFTEARGEYVMCMDPHVLFWPDAIKKLLAYYAANPDTNDLLGGVMVYDDQLNYATHFKDEWRAEMWGTWDTPFLCPCGFVLQTTKKVIQLHFNHTVEATLYSALVNPEGYLAACPKCGAAFPEASWHDHHGKLVAAGFRQLGGCSDDPLFEVPAQGLGVFSARKQSWLGFNEKFRGFGGEEWYIHEKYRKAGARCLCFPFLRWAHRFGRPGGTKYPLTTYAKVRNYVIGHAELGLSFDRLHRHFVEGWNDDGTPVHVNNEGKPFGSVPANEWAELMRDPHNPPETLQVAGCQSCPGTITVNPDATLEQLYEVAAQTPSDINGHCAKLKELASQVEHVTDFGMRHQVSSVALLAGQPKRMVSYGVDPFFDELKKRQGATEFEAKPGDSLAVEPEETDLCFIDTVHKGEHFRQELLRFAPKVRRWIVRHDTSVFGERGEDGGPGLLPTLRWFLKEYPEWSVHFDSMENNGLTVLTRDPRDKPELPSIATMAWNYGKAKVKHLLSGSHTVSEEQFDARLDVCALCPNRTGSRCSRCGCFLDVLENGEPGKAAWMDAECPIGKWAEVDRRFSLPMAS